MTDKLACHACRSGTMEATVRSGSYVLRCAACGEDVVAASFIAVLDTDQAFSAYVDPGHGKRPPADALIAAGPLRGIAGAIRSVADKGTSVLLVPEAR